MPTIEKQVTNLELSKQLKKAGYEQEGLWMWAKQYDVYNNHIGDAVTRNTRRIVGIATAPTVAELGERLPIIVNKNGAKYFLKITLKSIVYESAKTDWIFKATADTEANARAKMWLYLKREGLL